MEKYCVHLLLASLVFVLLFNQGLGKTISRTEWPDIGILAATPNQAKDTNIISSRLTKRSIDNEFDGENVRYRLSNIPTNNNLNNGNEPLREDNDAQDYVTFAGDEDTGDDISSGDEGTSASGGNDSENRGIENTDTISPKPDLNIYSSESNLSKNKNDETISLKPDLNINSSESNLSKNKNDETDIIDNLNLKSNESNNSQNKPSKNIYSSLINKNDSKKKMITESHLNKDGNKDTTKGHYENLQLQIYKDNSSISEESNVTRNSNAEEDIDINNKVSEISGSGTNGEDLNDDFSNNKTDEEMTGNDEKNTNSSGEMEERTSLSNDNSSKFIPVSTEREVNVLEDKARNKTINKSIKEDVEVEGTITGDQISSNTYNNASRNSTKETEFKGNLYDLSNIKTNITELKHRLNIPLEGVDVENIQKIDGDGISTIHRKTAHKNDHVNDDLFASGDEDNDIDHNKDSDHNLKSENKTNDTENNDSHSNKSIETEGGDDDDDQSRVSINSSSRDDEFNKITTQNAIGSTISRKSTKNKDESEEVVDDYSGQTSGDFQPVDVSSEIAETASASTVQKAKKGKTTSMDDVSSNYEIKFSDKFSQNKQDEKEMIQPETGQRKLQKTKLKDNNSSSNSNNSDLADIGKSEEEVFNGELKAQNKQDEEEINQPETGHRKLQKIKLKDSNSTSSSKTSDLVEHGKSDEEISNGETKAQSEQNDEQLTQPERGHKKLHKVQLKDNNSSSNTNNSELADIGKSEEEVFNGELKAQTKQDEEEINQPETGHRKLQKIKLKDSNSTSSSKTSDLVEHGKSDEEISNGETKAQSEQNDEQLTQPERGHKKLHKVQLKDNNSSSNSNNSELADIGKSEEEVFNGELKAQNKQDEEEINQPETGHRKLQKIKLRDSNSTSSSKTSDLVEHGKSDEEISNGETKAQSEQNDEQLTQPERGHKKLHKVQLKDNNSSSNSNNSDLADIGKSEEEVFNGELKAQNKQDEEEINQPETGHRKLQKIKLKDSNSTSSSKTSDLVEHGKSDEEISNGETKAPTKQDDEQLTQPERGHKKLHKMQLKDNNSSSNSNNSELADIGKSEEEVFNGELKAQNKQDEEEINQPETGHRKLQKIRFKDNNNSSTSKTSDLEELGKSEEEVFNGELKAQNKQDEEEINQPETGHRKLHRFKLKDNNIGKTENKTHRISLNNKGIGTENGNTSKVNKDERQNESWEIQQNEMTTTVQPATSANVTPKDKGDGTNLTDTEKNESNTDEDNEDDNELKQATTPLSSSPKVTPPDNTRAKTVSSKNISGVDEKKIVTTPRPTDNPIETSSTKPKETDFEKNKEVDGDDDDFDVDEDKTKSDADDQNLDEDDFSGKEEQTTTQKPTYSPNKTSNDNQSKDKTLEENKDDENVHDESANDHDEEDDNDIEKEITTIKTTPITASSTTPKLDKSEEENEDNDVDDHEDDSGTHKKATATPILTATSSTTPKQDKSEDENEGVDDDDDDKEDDSEKHQQATTTTIPTPTLSITTTVSSQGKYNKSEDKNKSQNVDDDDDDDDHKDNNDSQTKPIALSRAPSTKNKSAEDIIDKKENGFDHNKDITNKNNDEDDHDDFDNDENPTATTTRVSPTPFKTTEETFIAQKQKMSTSTTAASTSLVTKDIPSSSDQINEQSKETNKESEDNDGIEDETASGEDEKLTTTSTSTNPPTSSSPTSVSTTASSTLKVVQSQSDQENEEPMVKNKEPDANDNEDEEAHISDDDEKVSTTSTSTKSPTSPSQTTVSTSASSTSKDEQSQSGQEERMNKNLNSHANDDEDEEESISGDDEKVTTTSTSTKSPTSPSPTTISTTAASEDDHGQSGQENEERMVKNKDPNANDDEDEAESISGDDEKVSTTSTSTKSPTSSSPTTDSTSASSTLKDDQSQSVQESEEQMLKNKNPNTNDDEDEEEGISGDDEKVTTTSTSTKSPISSSPTTVSTSASSTSKDEQSQSDGQHEERNVNNKKPDANDDEDEEEGISGDDEKVTTTSTSTKSPISSSSATVFSTVSQTSNHNRSQSGQEERMNKNLNSHANDDEDEEEGISGDDEKVTATSTSTKFPTSPSPTTVSTSASSTSKDEQSQSDGQHEEQNVKNKEPDANDDEDEEEGISGDDEKVTTTSTSRKSPISSSPTTVSSTISQTSNHNRSQSGQESEERMAKNKDPDSKDDEDEEKSISVSTSTSTKSPTSPLPTTVSTSASSTSKDEQSQSGQEERMNKNLNSHANDDEDDEESISGDDEKVTTTSTSTKSPTSSSLTTISTTAASEDDHGQSGQENEERMVKNKDPNANDDEDEEESISGDDEKVSTTSTTTKPPTSPSPTTVSTSASSSTSKDKQSQSSQEKRITKNLNSHANDDEDEEESISGDDEKVSTTSTSTKSSTSPSPTTVSTSASSTSKDEESQSVQESEEQMLKNKNPNTNDDEDEEEGISGDDEKVTATSTSTKFPTSPSPTTVSTSASSTLKDEQSQSVQESEEQMLKNKNPNTNDDEDEEEGISGDDEKVTATSTFTKYPTSPSPTTASTTTTSTSKDNQSQSVQESEEQMLKNKNPNTNDDEDEKESISGDDEKVTTTSTSTKFPTSSSPTTVSTSASSTSKDEQSQSGGQHEEQNVKNKEPDANDDEDEEEGISGDDEKVTATSTSTKFPTSPSPTTVSTSASSTLKDEQSQSVQESEEQMLKNKNPNTNDDEDEEEGISGDDEKVTATSTFTKYPTSPSPTTASTTTNSTSKDNQSQSVQESEEQMLKNKNPNTNDDEDEKESISGDDEKVTTTSTSTKFPTSSSPTTVSTSASSTSKDEQSQSGGQHEEQNVKNKEPDANDDEDEEEGISGDDEKVTTTSTSRKSPISPSPTTVSSTISQTSNHNRSQSGQESEERMAKNKDPDSKDDEDEEKSITVSTSTSTKSPTSPSPTTVSTSATSSTSKEEQSQSSQEERINKNLNSHANDDEDEENSISGDDEKVTTKSTSTKSPISFSPTTVSTSASSTSKDDQSQSDGQHEERMAQNKETDAKHDEDDEESISGDDEKVSTTSTSTKSPTSPSPTTVSTSATSSTSKDEQSQSSQEERINKNLNSHANDDQDEEKSISGEDKQITTTSTPTKTPTSSSPTIVSTTATSSTSKDDRGQSVQESEERMAKTKNPDAKDDQDEDENIIGKDEQITTTTRTPTKSPTSSTTISTSATSDEQSQSVKQNKERMAKNKNPHANDDENEEESISREDEQITTASTPAKTPTLSSPTTVSTTSASEDDHGQSGQENEERMNTNKDSHTNNDYDEKESISEDEKFTTSNTMKSPTPSSLTTDSTFGTSKEQTDSHENDDNDEEEIISGEDENENSSSTPTESQTPLTKTATLSTSTTSSKDEQSQSSKDEFSQANSNDSSTNENSTDHDVEDHGSIKEAVTLAKPTRSTIPPEQAHSNEFNVDSTHESKEHSKNNQVNGSSFAPNKSTKGKGLKQKEDKNEKGDINSEEDNTSSFSGENSYKHEEHSGEVVINSSKLHSGATSTKQEHNNGREENVNKISEEDDNSSSFSGEVNEENNVEKGRNDNNDSAPKLTKHANGNIENNKDDTLDKDKKEGENTNHDTQERNSGVNLNEKEENQNASKVNSNQGHKSSNQSNDSKPSININTIVTTQEGSSAHAQAGAVINSDDNKLAKMTGNWEISSGASGVSGSGRPSEKQDSNEGLEEVDVGSSMAANEGIYPKTEIKTTKLQQNESTLIYKTQQENENSIVSSSHHKKETNKKSQETENIQLNEKESNETKEIKPTNSSQFKLKPFDHSALDKTEEEEIFNGEVKAQNKQDEEEIKDHETIHRKLHKIKIKDKATIQIFDPLKHHKYGTKVPKNGKKEEQNETGFQKGINSNNALFKTKSRKGTPAPPTPESSISVYKPKKKTPVKKTKSKNPEFDTGYSLNTIKTTKQPTRKIPVKSLQGKANSSYNADKSLTTNLSTNKTQPNHLNRKNNYDLGIKSPSSPNNKNMTKDNDTNMKWDGTNSSNKPGILLLADPKFKNHLHKLKHLFGKYMPVSVIMKINDIRRKIKNDKQIKSTKQEMSGNNSKVSGNNSRTHVKMNNTGLYGNKSELTGNQNRTAIKLSKQRLSGNTAKATRNKNLNNYKVNKIENATKINEISYQTTVKLNRPGLPENVSQLPGNKSRTHTKQSMLGIFGNMSALTGNKTKRKVNQKMSQLPNMTSKPNKSNGDTHWTKKLVGNSKNVTEKRKQRSSKKLEIKTEKKFTKTFAGSNATNRKNRSKDQASNIPKSARTKDKAPSKGGGVSALSLTGLQGNPHKSRTVSKYKKKPSPKPTAKKVWNYPHQSSNNQMGSSGSTYNIKKPGKVKTKPKHQNQPMTAANPYMVPTSHVTTAQMMMNQTTPFSSSSYKKPAVASSYKPKKPFIQKTSSQSKPSSGYKYPHMGANSKGTGAQQGYNNNNYYNNYNYRAPNQYGQMSPAYNPYKSNQQASRPNQMTSSKNPYMANNAAALKAQQYYSKQYPSALSPYMGYNSRNAGYQQLTSQRLNEKPSEVSKPSLTSTSSKETNPQSQPKPAPPMTSQPATPYMANNIQNMNPQVMRAPAPMQLTGVTSPMYMPNNNVNAGYPSYPMFIASPGAQSQPSYNYGTQKASNPIYTYQTPNPAGGYVIYDTYEIMPNANGVDCTPVQDVALPAACSPQPVTQQMAQPIVTQPAANPIVMKSASQPIVTQQASSQNAMNQAPQSINTQATPEEHPYKPAEENSPKEMNDQVNANGQEWTEYWPKQSENTQAQPSAIQTKGQLEAQYSPTLSANPVTQSSQFASYNHMGQLPTRPKNPFDIRNLMQLSEDNIEDVLKELDNVEHFYASRRKGVPDKQLYNQYGGNVPLSGKANQNLMEPKKVEYYVNDDMFDPNGNTQEAQSENQDDLLSSFENQQSGPNYVKKETSNQNLEDKVPGKANTNNGGAFQEGDLAENSDEHIFFRETGGTKSLRGSNTKAPNIKQMIKDIDKLKPVQEHKNNQEQNYNDGYSNPLVPENAQWYPAYEVSPTRGKQFLEKFQNQKEKEPKTPFKSHKHAKENFYLQPHQAKVTLPHNDDLAHMKVKIMNGLPENFPPFSGVENNVDDYSNSLGTYQSPMETQQHLPRLSMDGNYMTISKNPYGIETQPVKEESSRRFTNENSNYETDLSSFEKTDAGKKIVDLKTLLKKKLAMIKAKKKAKVTSNIEKFLNKEHKEHYKALGDLQESFDNPEKEGGVSYFGAAPLAKMLEGTDEGLEKKIVSLTGKTRENVWLSAPTVSSALKYAMDLDEAGPTKSSTLGPTYSHYKQRTGLFGFVDKDTERKCTAIGKTDFQEKCPKGWIAHVEFCYGIFEKPEKSWKAFPPKCAAHNAILAMPKTEEQLGFLKSHLKDRGLLNKEFHIGLHRKQHAWRWIDDNEFNLDSSYNDLYGRMHHAINCGTFYKGHVRSTKCSKQMPYICEIKRGMEAVRILAFGDSLTRGYYGGGKEHHPYTEKLEYLLNTDSHKCFLVDNQGKDKELATNMNKRLDKFLKTAPSWYKWIVILAGTNDIVHDKRPATEKNWDRVVHDVIMAHQTAHKYGFNTVVVTIPEIDCEQTTKPDCKRVHKERLYVNERLRHYAMETSAAVLSDLAWLLPRYAMETEKRMFFWEAGLHMRPQGYDRMAEIIYKDIVRNLR